MVFPHTQVYMINYILTLLSKGIHAQKVRVKIMSTDSSSVKQTYALQERKNKIITWTKLKCAVKKI